MIPMCDIQHFSPKTLSSLPIAASELARLGALSAPEREYELGLMIYSHLYAETCRVRHVAILHQRSDLSLQAHWQQYRDGFLARALCDYRRAGLIDRAEACASGFEQLGKRASADVSLSYARALASGMPPALYSYQICAQEKRLAAKRLHRAIQFCIELSGPQNIARHAAR